MNLIVFHILHVDDTGMRSNIRSNDRYLIFRIGVYDGYISGWCMTVKQLFAFKGHWPFQVYMLSKAGR